VNGRNGILTQNSRSTTLDLALRHYRDSMDSDSNVSAAISLNSVRAYAAG